MNYSTSTSTSPTIPVFAGHGIPSINAPQSRQQALLDASSPSGSILLSSCHDAFLAELSSLSITDLIHVDVDIRDFQARETLVDVPKDRYLQNPVISNTGLFLVQALRYLAHVETARAPTGTLKPFANVLDRNAELGLGILGFSSGILAACLVGTSSSLLKYISTAVEIFRLAVWIGIRCQLYRRHCLAAASLDPYCPLPWSVVLMGIDQEVAEKAVREFNKIRPEESIYVTAILDATCVTLSGRPDVLAVFTADLVRSVKGLVIHNTNVNTLYHSKIHALDSGVRGHVIADVKSRNIRFPIFTDLHVPIWSTHTGVPITSDYSTGSLLELVVDMILTRPVNWKLLLANISSQFPAQVPVRILNIGPGNGLSRTMGKLFPNAVTSIIDLTQPSVPLGRPKQEAIAIVGMAVRMPGAPDVEELWEVLDQGINTVTEIPESRFKITRTESEEGKSFRMRARMGNFIDGVDEFDNKFFCISPREARSMDPQQRILLQTAYQALEDSGYVPTSTPSSCPDRFGCYIGVATHDYTQNLRDDIDVYYSTGTLGAFLSGRVSYAMGFSGPSVVVDTACSSSCVAIYQGARALMNRDCDAALVGGVNIISSPEMFRGLDRGHFLSPTGQCKPFDASADGYCRSEGCGVFVIKRLSDAVDDNDRILGVIRGIEVNQSGRASSITHPHSSTQAALFRELLSNSGTDPSRVNVVEAHGTGTQAGDPVEMEAIRTALSQCRSSSNPLHVTSIKANIGHLEAASGVAGLAKLLLMLRHRKIPSQISLRTLNPRIIPLETDNTVIDVTPVPWEPAGGGATRIALLNNFGAAGSNVGLLVEEYQAKPPPGSEGPEISVVFGMSAKDEVALEALRRKYTDFLRDSPAVLLQDIAYTSTARRQLYDHRLAVSASTIEDLIQKIQTAPVFVAKKRTGRFVFVFSGQGGQYLGMGRELYYTTPGFKENIDRCHDILVKSGFPGILSIIDVGEGSCASGLSVEEEFEAFQAASFSLQYALSQLWISWGIRPSAAIGHSLGEYAALVVANVLSLQEALFVVATRARLMVTSLSLNETGMLAVTLGPREVEKQLGSSQRFPGVSIACYNGSADTVLAGPLAELDTFQRQLTAEVGCKSVFLSVPFAYHTPAMSPILPDLAASVDLLSPRSPTIPIVSTVLGEVVLPGDCSVFDSGYFSRHTVEPVFFERAIRNLLLYSSSEPFDSWIEIGPHATTMPMLKSNTCISSGTTIIGSLRKEQRPWKTLTKALAQLYVSGFDIQWRNVFGHLSHPKCVSLPSYPFVKSKYWTEYRESTIPSSPAQRTQTSHTFGSLGHWKQYPDQCNGYVAIFESSIQNLASSIVGHRVGGVPLCPASAYIERILAGTHLVCEYLGHGLQESRLVLQGVDFPKPLVYDEDVDCHVLTTIAAGDGRGTFRVGSRTGAFSDEVIHCNGEYELEQAVQSRSYLSGLLPGTLEAASVVAKPKDGRMREVFHTRTVYDLIFSRVVEYGQEYRAIKSITVDTNCQEACADILLPDSHLRHDFVVHPIFLDALLHVAGFVVNMQGAPDDAYICSGISSFTVLPEMVDTTTAYTIYCHNSPALHEDTITSDVYAISCDRKQIVACITGAKFRRTGLERLKELLRQSTVKIPLLPPFRMKTPSKLKVEVPRTSLRAEPQGRDGVSMIRSQIASVVSNVCPTLQFDAVSVLQETELDTFASTDFLERIGAEFPMLELDRQSLIHCKTIKDLTHEIATRTNVAEEFPSSPTYSSGTLSPITPVNDDLSLELQHVNVKSVLASVLDMGVDDLQEDVDLQSLGLDSMSSIEAIRALKHESGLDLPGNLFNVYHTPRKVHSFVASRLQNSRMLVSPEVGEPRSRYHEKPYVRIESGLLLLQESKTNLVPLVLIHDGSGLISCYAQLAPLGRPVWGLHNPYFATSESWDHVESMAKSYAKYIRDKIGGPLILGGWSFGGVLAYEVAIQLRRQDVETVGILLIDSPSPADRLALSEPVIDCVVEKSSPNCRTSLNTKKLMKAQFQASARMLRKHHPRLPRESECQFSAVLLRSRDGFDPRDIADVPAWLKDRSDPRQSVDGWQALLGSPIRLLDIPGNHFEAFFPSHINEVSVRIIEGCKYLEDRARPSTPY